MTDWWRDFGFRFMEARFNDKQATRGAILYRARPSSKEPNKSSSLIAALLRLPSSSCVGELEFRDAGR
jgi:hypothetical protein